MTTAPQRARKRYSVAHNPADEWVYNSANLDDRNVIWARAEDTDPDAELLHYYRTAHPPR